jgi:hypothetical protein
MRSTFQVGVPTVITAIAPEGPFSVVFEDAGGTGYAYGIRRRWWRSSAVLDALHLYNVETVKDREQAQMLEVLWSPDGMRAAIMLNGHPHAAFAFAERRAACMTAFPPASAWCRSSHEWDPTLIEFLARAS